jgi:D-alanyl-D-alanine carboxypeptidase
MKRLLVFILLFLMLFTSAVAEEPIYFKLPQIPPGTPEYNPDTPEKLIQDQLVGKSAILIEADGGDVIFEKEADMRMFPASTTKIMTILLALQAVEDWDEIVTFSYNAVNPPEGSSTGRFKEGEEISLIDLLYATMIVSANDGTIAIAEHISGSEAAFVEYMNRAAEAFGCTGTHFANSHGYHDPNHYTTARDLAIIAREAMNNEEFRKIAAATTWGLPRTNKQKARTVTNRTWFLDSSDPERSHLYYPAGTGIKTGNTSAAGYCFVGSASQDGVNLISVVLYSGEQGRFSDTAKLMNYGFSQYISVTPTELFSRSPITIETTNFSLKDTNLGQLTLYLQTTGSGDYTAVTIKEDEIDSYARSFRRQCIINYTRDFAAPISYGEEFGTLTYVPEEGNPIEYRIVAGRSIEARENAPKSIEQIEAETYADPNPFPPLSIELVFLLAWPFLAVIAAIVLLSKLFKRRRIKLAKVPNPIRRRFK